jgi:hypothetical protein
MNKINTAIYWTKVYLTINKISLPPPLLFYEEFRGCGRSGPPEGRNKNQESKA